MPRITERGHEGAARVLSLISVSNGLVKDCELRVLESLDAFTSLGVSRRRFLQLAAQSRDDIGCRLVERGHLHAGELLHFDQLLKAVRDRDQRLMVCRLAVAVVVADGSVTDGEREAVEYMLARWNLNPQRVARRALGPSKP